MPSVSTNLLFFFLFLYFINSVCVVGIPSGTEGLAVHLAKSGKINYFETLTLPQVDIGSDSWPIRSFSGQLLLSCTLRDFLL